MKYFKREEFSCKCGCGFSVVDYKLGEILDDMREHFNQRVIITSGCRCPKHNASIKGASLNSKHLLGVACDFKIENVSADNAADFLERKYPKTFGIGRYDGRTHLDIRRKKARWDKRSE